MKAFEQVVAEHGSTVLRVCRAVLGPVDCQDAWSDTFLAALRAYPDLDDRANVEAWLVRIARRKAIDVARVRARAPIPVDSVPEHPGTIGVSDGGDENLWDAVRALPAKQRQAVTFHYVAGLPYRDVAEILGVRTDAARRAAADGIKTLRRTYAGAVDVKGETR